MTLEELSKTYAAAAEPLRKRLHELRKMLSEAVDPEEIWHIKRRIQELTPMLTQMNDLAWMLEHYYERGGAVRDCRYGFTGKRPAKERTRKADENLASDTARRINRFAASNILGLSLRAENHGTDSPGEGREQVYNFANAEACGTENNANYSIFDAVNSRHFNKKDKRSKPHE